MNAKVKDSVRILHILDAIKEIELEIIGEAANGLSDEYISNHPGAPWARIFV